MPDPQHNRLKMHIELTSTKKILPFIFHLAGALMGFAVPIFALIKPYLTAKGIPNSQLSLAVILGTSLGILATLNLLISYAEGKQSTKIIKEKYKNLSVIGIMLNRRQTTFAFTTIALALTFITALTIAKNFLIAFIVLVLLLIFSLREYVFTYRVRKGWYGTNEYEAREIIQFIRDNADKIDFTDGGKPKKILSDADIAQLETTVRKSLAGQPGVA